jgi:ribonuclease T2
VTGLRLNAAIGAVFCCAVLTGCNPPAAKGGSDAAAPFDFYVLSLSWSPTFCAVEGPGNRQQCGTDKGYGFILHGLWPQFERDYPKDCDTPFGPDVDGSVVRNIIGIMPSNGLVRHEWRKHGSCSGLSQEAYFDKARAAFNSIIIPDDFTDPKQARSIAPDSVERAFIAANRDLPAQAIAVTCEQDFIDEVRICLTKELKFRKCAEVNNKACRANRKTLPGISSSR